MSHWAGGTFWTGNHDAHAISGVPKPRLLTELDWSDGDYQLRAELMTLAPSPVIANDMVLRSAPDLPRVGEPTCGEPWTLLLHTPRNGSA